jgi:hypothetical protein
LPKELQQPFPCSDVLNLLTNPLPVQRSESGGRLCIALPSMFESEAQLNASVFKIRIVGLPPKHTSPF